MSHYKPGIGLNKCDAKTLGTMSHLSGYPTSGVDAKRPRVLAVYTPHKEPKLGELVVLIEIPRGMLDDLPPEDQQAITDVVGKPILLNEYDDAGRAELEFKDPDGQTHYVFVAPEFIRAAH